MNEDDGDLIEQETWREIIGDKIICSNCKTKDSTKFDFGLDKSGPRASLNIQCGVCGHSGDYTPTKEEVYAYEYKARAAIDKKILETPHLKGKISNVKVTSVYREGDA
tara:strand:- start:95 stop:418 length:324 start_codon:yes stop_codon:yes gene_type:complete